MNSGLFRNICQEIEIGENGNKEPVWVKQLRNILVTDIHEKELGCRCDTHIKIGAVHLKSFYETRILFSHSVWIKRFSTWLCDELLKLHKDRIIVIGYETEVETVLFSLQQQFQNNVSCKEERIMQYGIFEEKKYTQNNGYVQTRENIRYLNRIKELIENEDEIEKWQLVFMCGTSSTLSTFVKMKKLFEVLIKEEQDATLDKWYKLLKDIQFKSLIQVLPDQNSNQTIFQNTDFGNKTVTRFVNGERIKSSYLVDVYCTWYDAGEKCPLCFPKNVLDEQPLIETSETSFVPFQMIRTKRRAETNDDMQETDYDTAREEAKPLLFDERFGLNYMLYDHIDRMDHHFKYYIRTAHLIKDILDNKYEGQRALFIDKCYEIKKKIFGSSLKNNATGGKKEIDVIVYPSNFGDEVFPLAINEYVFDNKAYMLSINPNKEFRSNFETKFSNLAYVLEQAKARNFNEIEIRFHYVAKQLLSIESYSRIKSFLNSLMSKHSGGTLPKCVKLFSTLIIYVSRMSESSVSDFIRYNHFFAFINVKVPSLRNYGDSCPICKRRQEVADYARASSLDICAAHWADKYEHYKAKSIEKAISDWEAYSEPVKKRKYNRFICENAIWEKIEKADCISEKEYVDALIFVMGKATHVVSAEDFISFVKAMTGPFLYYREKEKHAALHLVIYTMEKLCEMKPVLKKNNKKEKKIIVKPYDSELSILFNSVYEQYTTLIVLMNCLAGMESTYILRPEEIIKLCKFVNTLSNNVKVKRKPIGKYECDNIEDDNCFKSSLLIFGNQECLIMEFDQERHYVEAFLSCIVYSFKRVICGISGEEKSQYFEKLIDNVDEILKTSEDLSNELYILFYVLYLENNIETDEILFETKDIISKYRNEAIERLMQLVSEDKKADIKLFFAYKDSNFNNLYPLGVGNDSNKSDKILERSIYEQVFNEQFEMKYKECFDSEMLENCGWTMSKEKDIFVVSLKDYSVENQNTDAKENDYKQKAEMFLVLEFECKQKVQEDSFRIIKERLKILRSILRVRYSLCRVIEADIANNSIKEAIQAREAEIVMSQGKTVAHNGAEDLKWSLFLITNELENLCHENSNDEKVLILSKVCMQISTLISYAIGQASNEYLLRTYYGREKAKESILRNGCYHFVDTNCLLTSVKDNKAYLYQRNFLKYYFIDLLGGDDNAKRSVYHSSIFGDENGPLIGKVVYKLNDIQIDINSIDEILKLIENVNSLPVIFQDNNLSVKTSMGCIFLVGLIDLMIRNVGKHAKGSDVEILFSEGKTDDGTMFYSIEVINNMNSQNEDKLIGVTKWFFEVLNARNMFGKKSCFELKMHKNIESHKYHSQIIVYGK